MIFEESRYENSEVTSVPDSKGVYHATVSTLREVFAPSRYTNHRVVQGDRLDVLASAAYGDPELWWVIADANPELDFPDQLTPGQVIKVPVSR